jgi:hypothetical protein
MEKIKFPILITTMLVLMVNIMPFLGVKYSIIILLLFSAPFIIIWMVYRTLRDGIPSNKTFETHWYEDQVV